MTTPSIPAGLSALLSDFAVQILSQYRIEWAPGEVPLEQGSASEPDVGKLKVRGHAFVYEHKQPLKIGTDDFPEATRRPEGPQIAAVRRDAGAYRLEAVYQGNWQVWRTFTPGENVLRRFGHA